MTTPQQSLQAQVNEVTQFSVWLAGTLFLLWVGKTVGGMEKQFVNDVLDIATPEEIPLRIPQTTGVTTVCPVCGRTVEVPHGMSRSDALLRHLRDKAACPGPSGKDMHPQAILIEGGEPIPVQYSDLIGFIGNEPLPAHILMTLLPAVETEAGEKKIDAVMRQLKSGVEGIVDSHQFRMFLTTMSKFHTYSIGNQILIMLQKPDATRVAGFNAWKELGRWVKKDEKGISILAPVMTPRPICPECGAKLPKNAIYCPGCAAAISIEIESSPRFFKVVHVFDIAQTEGEPLPEFDVPTLTTEVNEQLFSKVLALSKAQGVTVSFEPDPHMDPEVKGYYRRPKFIWVRPEEPRAQQLKTFLHEVAHYYSEGVFRIPRRDAETIAESAAYVVGAHYGFDSGVRSFPYVALWAQDKKVLEENLSAIRRVATTILEGLG